jgi:UDP-N-acetylglucosamine acyltransferase
LHASKKVFHQRKNQGKGSSFFTTLPVSLKELELLNNIHPTAILEGNIRMGARNTIGPHVVLRGNISMGDDNVFKTGVCFENNVTIGHQNVFYPYVSVGALGEMGAKGDRFVEEGGVAIGDEVVLREFVCVHSPVYKYETTISSRVYIMNKGYVAHDCVIGEGVMMSAGVLLGGRVEIGDYANLGLGATVHQRVHIGKYAMVGMQAVISKDILPYSLVAGNPARIMRFNRVGAERSGLDEKLIAEMEALFYTGQFSSYVSDNTAWREIREFMEMHPASLLRLKS